MKTDLINLGIGQGAAIAILGYCVVFLGLVLLMLVVLIMASYFINKAKKEATVQAAAATPATAPAPEAAPVKDL
ncbi:MAG: OadG family protein, partial [Oscillospiraceae bacterium]|nr:OadG family protein [Oscillospiraceae bacterium]